MPRLPLLLASLLAAGAAAAAPASEPWDVRPDTWVARDTLGRELPSHADVGAPRPDRQVGAFYFLWHRVWRGPGHEAGFPPHDNSQYLQRDTFDRAGWGGPQTYWGEPEDGFYLSTDPYIIRKHAAELSNAGVDVLIFDATNDQVFLDIVEAMVTEFDALRALGWQTPRIAWLCNALNLETLQAEVYRQGRWREHWYQFKGKPLLLWCNPEREDLVTDEIRDFHTLRLAWFNTAGQDTWAWLHLWPQQWGWTDDPLEPEAMAVGIGSHPTLNIGRSNLSGVQPPFDPKTMGTETEALGLFHAQQWEEALAADPEFVFHTGWNEWISAHYTTGPEGGSFLGKPTREGDYFHVDSYNTEYNRDAEPMRDHYGDATYHQLWANVRRYKGARPAPVAGPTKSVTIDGAFDDWAAVQPEFRDRRGDAARRDFGGMNEGLRYKNDTGRNDIRLMKVAHDAESVSFYAETEAPLSAPDGAAWMNLLIDADRDLSTGWEGFEFALNRERDGATATVSRAVGEQGAFAWWTAPREAVQSDPATPCPSFAGAPWIWAPGDPAGADVQLWRPFTLQADTRVQVLAVGHRAWRLALDGKIIAEGTGHEQPRLVDLGLLPAGQHEFIASVQEETDVLFPFDAAPNGFLLKALAGAGELVTDGAWRARRGNDGDFQPARVVGEFGVQPWGQMLPVAPVALVDLDASGADSFTVALPEPTRLREARVRFLVADAALHGKATVEPAEWSLEWLDGAQWRPVPNATRERMWLIPRCERVRFDEVEASALRVVVRGAAGARVALSEVRLDAHAIPAAGGMRWDVVGRVPYAVAGNRMELQVPRALLGLAGEGAPELHFKWVDNWQRDLDAREFAIHGDAAPDRRAAYQYIASAPQLPPRPVDRRLRLRSEVATGPMHPHSMAGARSFGQTFIAEHAEGSNLHLGTPTWGRAGAPVDLRVEVLRGGPGGEAIFSEVLPRARVADGSLLIAAPLRYDVGQPYHVRLTPLGDVPAETLGWWGSTADAYPGGSAFINDEPVGFDFKLAVDYWQRPGEDAP